MTGLEIFNVFILVFLVVAALISLRVKDLLSASMVFGIYSFLICLLWAEMGAVDVAFTEAAVGAGVSAVFLVATVFNVKRRSSD
ncbi:MAG: cation:proton antiporter [Opitutae bacterium]|nr:cation:proton antiporter [Opitutae bacterium]|tara:strand:- start:346 stop:597 length:252 start_codon:yes stop_codon:yes gene_type:complete